MKPWHALLMNAVVVAAGLLVYDAVRGPRSDSRSDDDPLSDAALERFELQFDEIKRRRGPTMGRRARIAAYVERLGLSINRATRSKLATVLDKFQGDRLAFFERVPANAPDYDTKYRAFVDTYIARVGRLVPDSKEAATVVERFVFDGRIIKKPEPAKAGPGQKPGK